MFKSGFLALIVFLSGVQPSFAASKLRIVCYRTADFKRPDLKIKSVAIIEQIDTSQYDGELFLRKHYRKPIAIHRVPFQAKVYRTEMMPDHINADNAKEYSQSLLDNPDKKAVEHRTLGSRVGREYVFERTDRNGDLIATLDYVFLMPKVLTDVHYSTEYDQGPFTCFEPFTVPVEATPQATQSTVEEAEEIEL